ncbi:MAG: PilZ domain-containing protein [Xanthobacteraceae bacterium]
MNRLLSGGFVLKIEQTAAESEALALRINGFDKIKNHDAPERRRARRVIPRNRHSLLTWPDGKIEACLILDISVSGAAVSAQTLPEIGAALALGRLAGRVVRLFKGGFGIQFTEEVQRDVALKLLYK